MSDSIDIQSLRKLSGGDDVFIRDILSLYLNSTPSLLDELLSFHKENDKDLFLEALHKLKSASLSLGLDRIKEQIIRLENITKSNDLSQVYEMLLELKDSVEKVIATAERQIKELDN